MTKVVSEYPKTQTEIRFKLVARIYLFFRPVECHKGYAHGNYAAQTHSRRYNSVIFGLASNLRHKKYSRCFFQYLHCSAKQRKA